MSTLYVRNAVKFLRSSGFLSKVESAVDLNQLDQLSTFGLLFKSNLLRLLHQLDRHSLFPVFPAARLGHLDESLSARLLTNCSLTSNQTISSSSLQAQPFALRTDQINSSSSLITSIGDLSWNCDHQQSLAVYCASSHALNTFQWMQSSRHRLWRSLSQFPANFFLKELRTASESIHQLVIEFRKADLVIPLEKISYEVVDDHMFCDPNSNLSDRHVIKCDTYVDNCAIALLLDALVDKSNRSVMMLNERLVPYQVAVALIGSVDEPSSEVIDYLYSLTKHLHISVYPFLNQIQSLEAQFDSLDKIGILYTIIVDNLTLSKGIVHLRNRDTEIMEQQHISKIQEYLPLYTKMRRPHEIVESKQLRDKNEKIN